MILFLYMCDCALGLYIYRNQASQKNKTKKNDRRQTVDFGLFGKLGSLLRVLRTPPTANAANLQFAV